MRNCLSNAQIIELHGGGRRGVLQAQRTTCRWRREMRTRVSKLIVGSMCLNQSKHFRHQQLMPDQHSLKERPRPGNICHWHDSSSNTTAYSVSTHSKNHSKWLQHSHLHQSIPSVSRRHQYCGQCTDSIQTGTTSASKSARVSTSITVVNTTI